MRLKVKDSIFRGTVFPSYKKSNLFILAVYFIQISMNLLSDEFLYRSAEHFQSKLLIYESSYNSMRVICKLFC